MYLQHIKPSLNGILKIFAISMLSYNVTFGQTLQVAQEAASAVSEHLESNKPELVCSLLSPDLQKQLPCDQFVRVWASIKGKVGEIRTSLPAKSYVEKGILMQTQLVEFEKATLEYHINVEVLTGKVVGIFFSPVETDSGYTLPDYNVKANYTTKDLKLATTKTISLPATLYIPVGTIKHALVLVHGSGPSDKDETVGPNKIFKDLAVGLASNGIAVLTYDKRTKGAVKTTAEADALTIDSEVIEDAIATVKYLKNDVEATKNAKVIVLGHSLGAMLAPLIANRAGSKYVSGIIMMAAPARPLEDMVLMQYNYLIKADTTQSKGLAEELPKLKQEIANLRQLESGNKGAEKLPLPLGLKAPYWRSITAYKQVKVASDLKIPVLVMQGERDYQVTNDDFEIWKANLAGSNFTLKSYKNLNHLFLYGVFPSKPSEYADASNIPKNVIIDVVNWVNAH